METAACSQTALVKLDSCVVVCRVSDLCILVEVDGCTGLLDSLSQRRDPGWFELQNLSDRRWASVPVSIPCGVTPTDHSWCDSERRRADPMTTSVLLQTSKGSDRAEQRHTRAGSDRQSRGSKLKREESGEE